jgi:phage/plasmid-associated DNA primase
MEEKALKGEERKEEERGMREYARRNGIMWMPIGLKWEEGKKKLCPIGNYMPKPTDFAEMSEKEIERRQKMEEEYEYIALDTREIYQIDVDTEEIPEKLVRMMDKIPYFLSASKKLPHFLIKSETKVEQKRYLTKLKNVELLCGQWSFCHKNAEIYNEREEIPKVGLESLIQENEKRKINVGVKEIEYNTLSEVVNGLKEERCQVWEYWLNTVFAILKTGEENGYPEQAANLAHMWSKRNARDEKQYDKKFLDKIIERGFNAERSPTFGTLCYYLKQDNREKFEKLLEYTNEKIKHNDLSACEEFEKYLEEQGYKYVKVGTTKVEIYWYHVEQGVWQEGLDGIRSIIVQCYALGEYRVSARLQSNMLLIFKDKIKKEPDFYLKAYNSTKHKIAFNNGIYDFEEKKLIPFDAKYVFLYKLKWDYTEKINEKLAKEIKQKIFYDVFDKTRGDYYMDILSRAIAGDCEDKNFIIVIGDGNSGKGMNCAIAENAFGAYCMTYNAESLQLVGTGGDQAKNKSWLVAIKNSRIAVANEVSMTTPLDGNKIKTFSGGGDTIMARINNKDEINFKLQCTPFYYVNDMPKIKPLLQELKNRLKYIETQYTYLDKANYEKQKELPNVKLGDPKIKTHFCTNEEILRTYAIMICHNYKNYEPEPPEEVLKSIEEWTESDDVNEQIKEMFEKTDNPNDIMSAQDVCAMVKQLGLEISDTRIGKQMAKLGFHKTVTKINKKSKKVYMNIKVRNEEGDNIEL